MKLNEVFFTPDQLKYKQTKQSIEPTWNRLTKPVPGRERIGSGYEADAYSNENDPGNIDKIAKPGKIKSLSNDAYYQYLDALAHNERIANNPFFPRIFNLKTFRSKDGKYTYKVNMEKLNPLDTLSLEELVRIGNELFSDFNAVYQERKEGHESVNKMRTKSEYATNVLTRLAQTALAQCFHSVLTASGPSTNIKNAHLKQAMMLIRSVLYKNKRFVADLHKGNIMVRRGPFAPQLVITDPIVTDPFPIPNNDFGTD